ncbi:MAG: SRPBCC family protein [Acidimicrobiia bacterium]
MDMPKWSQSIFIAASTSDLYAMVSDVTRMGEWSPVCRWCRWDDGAGPEVGAWFTGHNEDDGREWDTHCEVVAADPGREFAFAVHGTFVRWSYTFAPAVGDDGADGTTLTETWEPQPDLLAFYAKQYGDDEVQAVLDARTDTAKRGIAETLAAIKRSAEAR